VAGTDPPGRETVHDHDREGSSDEGRNNSMTHRFDVVVSAGSLRSQAHDAVGFAHRWTAQGVSVETDFTGAHLLHLATAGCVLNDVYREAAGRDLPLTGVRVTASGGFDPDTWASTGITYRVTIDAALAADDLDALLAAVDAVAEIPRAIRAGAPVTRV
jgi:uncharacterized OsmC-like protein